jgi:hypothetical protein
MSKLISKYNDAATSPAQAPPTPAFMICATWHATTLLLAGVPVHIVAARLGHADPAVTLRIYSHVLREHTLGVGDVFARAVKASVSKSVSKPGQQDEAQGVCAGESGQGRDRTAGLPIFRDSRSRRPLPRPGPLVRSACDISA